MKPGRELSYPRQQDYFDGFRDHLNRAVTRRLQTDYTIAAELSGGFDSSSVVVTAGEIYRTTPEGLPPFETLSRVFGEMACDESDYIRAVNERVPFNSNCFSPPEEVGYEGVAEEQWRTDTPAAHLPGGETLHMRRIFSAIGARTLLTGLGGDEVVWDNDYVNDLAACGRYLDYLKASRRVSAGPGAWLNSLARSVLRWMTPSPARRLYRNTVGGSWRPPDWAHPETVERFARYLQSVEQVSAGFPTPSQNAAARGVQSPRLLWELETLESRRVHQGVELRHPFLDRALAEYVLAIPFAQRLPPGGQRKYLTRRGLGSLLPDIVRLREYKTPFSAFENERIRKSREMTEGEIFGSDRWVSARYVSKERSAGLWRQYQPPGTATRLVNQPIEAVATLELWLRNLGRYEEQKLP